MTLKQLLSRVMRALPNESPDRWGTDDIIEMLNDAQNELAIASQKFTVQEYELDADYANVPFPDDVLMLMNVYWGQADSDTKAELYQDMDALPTYDEDGAGDEEDEFSSGAGDPRKYYVKDGRLILRPIPDTDGIVTTVYIKRPTLMADMADTPEFDDSEKYLVSHVLRRIHMESGSQMFQLWNMEQERDKANWLSGAGQNYQRPFRVKSVW